MDSLRALKTQLNLAVGQREEDPERAWLEAMTVRDRLVALVGGIRDDALLAADAARFRDRLEEKIHALTRDIGDEVVAPLYSWIDLLRQRTRLEGEVATARARVAEARASRGGAGPQPPERAAEAAVALESCEAELAWWKGELPPAPPPEALAAWQEAGGDALRASLPADPAAVAARGRAARALVDAARGRPLGAFPYVGSRLELALLPAVSAAALLSLLFAFATPGAHPALSALAVVACGTAASAIMVSVQSRRRAAAEVRAALDVVWHHAIFTEQASALELEVGWLRALSAALRAREAFDAHKGEGGQLDELAKWRPDLAAVVAEVAKSSLERPFAR